MKIKLIKLEKIAEGNFSKSSNYKSNYKLGIRAASFKDESDRQQNGECND